MLSINKAIIGLGLLAASTISNAVPVDLGTASDYTLLGAGPGASPTSGLMQLGSEAIIHGNVGGRGFVGLSSGVEIHGNLDGGYFSSAPDATVFGDTTVRSDAYWDGVYADLQAASIEALSYGGQSLSSITSTTVLSSQGSGLSVYNIDGSISLGSGESLTISGSSSDTFIINVSEKLYLDSLSGILLDGVEADNVLFNFYGAGSDDSAYNNHLATIIGGAEFSGTFIAPRAYWQIGDGAIMNATRVLANGLQGNLQEVFGITPGTPVEVPEPSSLYLLAGGLALILLRRKINQKRSA
ncbi:collagen-binding domain-containing protein [Teredinibacter sp. KSP-S5-2]|uniref:collagen-binding domain-containing protein n=1 Tax=Teredinibacter sp. KSP-S5-2 TaxID=3034506 RepID=UPI002934BA61|nr:collagen-binding domain-containing protein [Teredinibacter sp. KSP-S5-2]WNO09258.1 choice-of-anchor A family protein [Teredinibacter sp. KSP-S5-2]